MVMAAVWQQSAHTARLARLAYAADVLPSGQPLAIEPPRPVYDPPVVT